MLAASALAGATAITALTGVAAAQPAAPAHDVAERVILAPAADAARGMTVTFRAAEQGAAVEYRPAGGGAEPVWVDATPKGTALTG